MKETLRLKIFRLMLFFLLPVSLFAQSSGTIAGKVVDDSGDPLIGVNVVIKGTTNGTVTNFDGDYVISDLNLEPITIEVSFIGYLVETYTIDLSKSPNAKQNVVLVEDIKELSEVVVIGYGTQKKSDLTSAVASVSAEDLDRSRSANVTEALQGQVTGVKITSNTGAPGANVSVQIRGITSINSTDPLWIIDGVAGDPNSVSAADIESMEILKDASSAAIYGANAGSGVVLITTKKGKAGKANVTFNANFGVQSVANQVDVNSGTEFINMYHEWETLANQRNYFSNEPDTFKTYNYQDMIFRQAIMQTYDVGASGGNENTTFYMGASYTSQEGVLIGSDYEKITARVNGQHKANEWLTVGINSSFSNQVWEGMEEWELKDEYASPILAATTFHSFVAPYADEKQTDSEYDQGWSATPLGNTTNPLATVNLKNYQRQNTNTTGTFFAAITPVVGLKFESRITGNASFGNTYNFEPIYYITGSLRNTESKIMKANNWYKGWTWQNILTYNKTFFDSHNTSFLVGYESGYGKSEWLSATRNNLINQSPEMWYFDASLDGQTLSQLPNGSANETSGYSYFGRVSYDYKSMLLFQANVRRDYSSLFGPNNRDGLFPSFSGGLKFTEIEAVRNALPFVNFGKVRVGWGKVGNNTLRPNSYFATVSPQLVYNYAFNSDETATVGAAPDQIPNYNIGWEEVVSTTIGLDLRFFNSKLSFTADYFNRHNNDMIMAVPQPGYTGMYVRSPFHEGGSSDPMMNIGEMINNGVELALGWKEQRGAFSYGANVNMTFLKTEVGNIQPDTLYLGSAKGIGSSLTRLVSNQPFDIFYGYKTDGIFRLSDTPNGDPTEIVTNQPYTVVNGEIVYAQPKARPGDFKFKDVNDDGKIDDNDMVALGSPHPSFIYSFSLFADYNLPKDLGTIDFNAFFQGEYGKKIFNATKYYLFNTDGGFNWLSEYTQDHYTTELTDRNGNLVTEANDNAKYPRIDPVNSNNNFTTLSDFYVEDGSYLRLKNLEIGYTLPERWTKAIKVSKIRIYGAGKNLLTFTKYSGLDPEVGIARNQDGFTDPRTAGVDKAAYPTARMYSIGINVTF